MLTEYQLHDSLKKELQDLGVTRIPSSEKIQKRIESLEAEQTSTILENQELQKKQQTLDIIQQNPESIDAVISILQHAKYINFTSKSEQQKTE